MLKNNNICLVCGMKFDNYYPWGIEGDTPSFDICCCCGVEFSHEDSSLAGIKDYRNEWLKNIAKWFEIKMQPINWDLTKQLSQISKLYT